MAGKERHDSGKSMCPKHARNSGSAPGFDGRKNPWDGIEATVGRVLVIGDPLLCLCGDHAITHPIMRVVRQRHTSLAIRHVEAHPDIYGAMSRTSPRMSRRSF